MNQFQAADLSSGRRLFRKWSLLVLLPIGVVLLLIGVLSAAWLTIGQVYRTDPKLIGGVMIDDFPTTRIYVGDTLVGVGKAVISWDTLLGLNGSQSPALEVPPESAMPTAEQLAGPGARDVVSPLFFGTGTTKWITTSHEYRFLRRRDGSLDVVNVLRIDLKEPSRKPRSFVLPFRLREGDKRSTTCFIFAGVSRSQISIPAALKFLGVQPDSVQICPSFGKGNQPWWGGPRDEATWKEIEEKGFWQPAP